jgi:ankyrin repeat protein
VRLRIRDSAPPVGGEAISEVERRLGIALPADYRAFVLMHNGGIPRPGWFRLGVKDEWMADRPSRGNLWWLWQKYGNEAIRERWRDRHRVSRILGIAAGDEGRPGWPGFEQAYRERPPGLPAHLAPIADVEGFVVNGRLCLDVSPDGPGRGRVYYWPDAAPSADGVEPAPLAPSFDAMLERLGDPGERPPEWLTLVQDGDRDGLRRWLDGNPARLRDQDEWGWTALDHSVFEGRWEIVDDLLARRDAAPGMVFYDALVDGRFPTARGMLRFELDPDLIRPSLARKAAEFWTDPDMVRAFLDAGADPDYIDDVASYGNAPLHYASQAGALEAVRLLLARGADPMAENEQGESPRDLAAWRGHDRVAEALDEAAAGRPTGPALEDEPEEVDLHSVVMSGPAGGLDEDALAALEARLGVRLPGEYRGFLKRFNGGKPRPARFRLRDRDDSGLKCEVRRFLSVEGGPRFADDADLESTRARLADWGLPRRMLPIATVDDELSGGLLCISVRGKDRSRVAYYPRHDSSDATTYPVATTLSRFFAGLSKAKDKTPAWVRAIEADDPEALEGWLAGGGTLKKRYRGRTPLEIAVGDGKIRVIRWLMGRGVEAQAAFDLALAEGRADVMLDLLDRGVVPPVVPASALGRLFFAPAVWRSAELVTRLIDLGADVNAADGSRQTPLMTAAQHATPEVLRLMLRRGARANVWNQRGEMALHRAVCSTSRPEMLEKMRLLIDAGEDLHARAPDSALPDHVLKTARAMQTPIGEILERGGPPVPSLAQLLGSLAAGLDDLLAGAPDVHPGGAYLGQFRRTAADLLTELRKDAEAVAELEAYALRSRPGGP